MEEAICRVLYKNALQRSVTKALNICHVTLSRYVKTVRNSPDADGVTTLPNIGYSSTPVFNQQIQKTSGLS